MHIALIITAGIALVIAAFAALNLPDVPPVVVSTWDAFVDFIAQWRSFFVYWLSGPIYTAILVIGIAIIAFEPIYHGILWVLKKIPMLGIK